MKLHHTSLIIPGLLIAFTVSAQTPLNTDQEKFSYGLGMMIGERVLKQYDEVDYQILLEGMKAQHQGKETSMDISEAGQIISQFQQKQDEEKYASVLQEGEAYLKSNATQDGVTITASGLQYSAITATDGPKPAASDSVTVHYRGTLLDGTEFDSSYARGEPATFALNQVIPGWTEGVQLMGVGSKFKFVIPFQLAYGERGAGNSIGPYETLIFEIELLKIN
ncbi:MAG: FKBP-type peptidyl-prolyl cis-trans isomerase [Gammaproteobacteria bacterium]